MSFKKGSILEKIEVTDAGSKGKNIAQAGNFVVLVDNAVPGDVVDVQVYRKKKDFAEGRAIRFHSLSPTRQQAVCSHFEACGGCSWQNIQYGQQLYFKQKTVTDTLERIGKVDMPDIDPILPSPRTEYYRNRLDFAFAERRWLTREEMNEGRGFGEPGLGFHISGQFDKVLDLQHCYLLDEPANSIRMAVRQWAIANEYPFFNVRQQAGSLRSLIIRTTTTGEVMVIVIFYKETPERVHALMQFLKDSFPEITSLYYVMNAKANDTVYDLPHELFSGKSYMTENLNGVNYRIGPKSFFQTNPFQAARLFAKTVEFAGLKGNEVVYDLYTGVGSIALQVARQAQKVIGIETVAEAIDYARLNAADNDMHNTEFFAGDVRDILTDDFIAQKGKPDVIITDPPRTGMEAPVINKILELLPERIVYVSCNPATQARDVALLKEHYILKKVQPVDMFPHTYHVENIVLLERKEN